MTPTTSPVLGGIEQILLVVFILMIFVGTAGGNPSMVLKPLFEIVSQIVMALISLLCALLTSLLQIGMAVLLSGSQTLAASIQSRAHHKVKR